MQTQGIGNDKSGPRRIQPNTTQEQHMGQQRSLIQAVETASGPYSDLVQDLQEYSGHISQDGNVVIPWLGF